MIPITHPNLPAVVRRVSEQAYRTWSKTGWVRADEPDGERAELLERAEQLGLSVRSNAKTETIAQQVAEADEDDGSDG